MENEVAQEVTTEPVKEETLSFDDMLLKDKEYQKEFDRRVSKALETAKGNWLKEAEEKQSEADKLAKMKDDEKRAYELEKITKERDSYFAELNANKLEKQAIEIANENGVDIEMLGLINFATIKAEDVEPTIKNFKSIIDKAVEKEVNSRLKEPTPKSVVGTTRSTTTMPTFF